MASEHRPAKTTVATVWLSGGMPMGWWLSLGFSHGSLVICKFIRQVRQTFMQ